MECSKLYTSSTMKFAGIEGNLNEAEYLILGVPLDITSTYRSGSRFGPNAIREASMNLETYCFRNGLDIEVFNVYDIGNLNILGNLDKSLRCLQQVVSEFIATERVPILLGGEHTLTYGSTEAFQDVAILSFDAHMDLRDEYAGIRLSHATFMRRLCESFGPDRVVEIGVRAVCREELAFAKQVGLNYITSLDVLRHGSQWVVDKVTEKLSNFKEIYLTIDMDVLDPSFAPAVANPVPEGLSPTLLLDILQPLCDQKIVGLDVVEVTPHYDSGVTAFQAAYILFNILAFIRG